MMVWSCNNAYVQYVHHTLHMNTCYTFFLDVLLYGITLCKQDTFVLHFPATRVRINQWREGLTLLVVFDGGVCAWWAVAVGADDVV